MQLGKGGMHDPSGGLRPPNSPVTENVYIFRLRNFGVSGQIFAQETECLLQIWRFLIKTATCKAEARTRALPVADSMARTKVGRELKVFM